MFFLFSIQSINELVQKSENKKEVLKEKVFEMVLYSFLIHFHIFHFFKFLYQNLYR